MAPGTESLGDEAAAGPSQAAHDSASQDEAVGPGSSEAEQSAAKAALPPPSEQPTMARPSVEQQRAGEDTRKPASSDPVADEGGPSAVETFASEEGLAARAGEPARRHLGEFEDDEILSSPEADAARPIGVTDAYRGEADRPHDTPASSPSSFGSLFGAALAGALLTLLGGSILVYSGLLPVSGPAAQPNQFASAGDLETVSSELATLRETVGQLQSADAAGGTGGYASASDLASLNDRLAALEQGGGDEPGAPAIDPQALQSAQDTAAGAEQAAGTAQSAADEARSLAEEAQALAGEVQTLANETGGRIDGIETRLAAIEEAQSQSRIALAAAGLKAAIDRGDPFEPELEAFASAGGSPDEVEPLRAFAPDGVPTQNELSAQWTQVEADIRRAIVQPDESAGVGGQLLAGLSSLVTVRQTGDEAASGNGADAILSRMSAAMAAGDLAAWLDERGALDAPAQEASEDFAARVEARRQAATIVDDTLGRASGAATANEG